MIMKRCLSLLILAVLLAVICVSPYTACADVFDNTRPPDITPSPEPSKVFDLRRLQTNTYGIVGSRAIECKVTVRGGAPGYMADYSIYRGSTLLKKASALFYGSMTISYMPEKKGTYRFIVRVTDSEGASESKEITIPVSPKPRFEYPSTWEATLEGVEQTGNWADDLIVVAQTQLGYTEDPAFIYKDGAEMHYSRYGEWYGASYAEWCVMFISFCAHYAGIPKEVIPQEAGCVALMEHFQKANAFYSAGSDYTPGKGDIIFMDYTKKKGPTHVGIVENFDGENVYTIEGNTTKGVVEKSYKLSDPQIFGFGSFRQVSGQTE